MIHRDHAKQMIVVLCDRFAGPVFVNVTNGEIFEASAKWSLMSGHEPNLVPQPGRSNLETSLVMSRGA